MLNVEMAVMNLEWMMHKISLRGLLSIHHPITVHEIKSMKYTIIFIQQNNIWYS